MQWRSFLFSTLDIKAFPKQNADTDFDKKNVTLIKRKALYH
jgi:hypothetical protein